MKILDSNILIYSYSEAYKYLRELIWSENVFASEISRLEVLGFHGMTKPEEEYFLDLFFILKTHEIDRLVLDEAIQLRKSHKMRLGDSIVAATALVPGLEIYTRNVADFVKVQGLKVINPIP
jgi:predicted nucleic acid-binding protein